MSASPEVRSLRAAMFAVLCVLLAAGGHGLASGEAPPLWADGAGFLVVFAVGCLLSGRERSLLGIGGGMLATQAGLHVAFEAARPRMTMNMHGMPMGPPHAHAMTPHATAAHVAAAVLATWWLRRGEAAFWCLLRRAVGLVPGLAAWWRVRTGPPAGPVRPDAVRPKAATPGPLRQVLLRHAVSRRGPPPGLSYAS
ncbi:hypothetical protein GFH48_26160 [Streptomyces fagopyri]|uniref:Uncharacterized protein n=1 Tax=Streptomyces fagopyri TaxID=2662397 RepID=A0A5Q0LI93_9ACTN|nr:hypothetical protein [Streptomyces fagopyri]QFZ76286.1 hypothetical protein GFH48_26160 [Streptomyces fagopyri]